MASKRKITNLVIGKLYTFSVPFYCFLYDGENYKNQSEDYCYLSEIIDPNYWNLRDILIANEVDNNITKFPCVFLGTKNIGIQKNWRSKIRCRDLLCFLFNNKIILVDKSDKSYCIAV